MMQPTPRSLLETFGPRVIGIQISRHGDGMNLESRPVRHGQLPVYTIGRTYLLELFHTELQSDLVRIADRSDDAPRPMSNWPIWRLEYREGGAVYTCPPGKHDDLGISCAMLAWAARHPAFGQVLAAAHLAARGRAGRSAARLIGGLACDLKTSRAAQ